jgi:hypothetical protein
MHVRSVTATSPSIVSIDRIRKLRWGRHAARTEKQKMRSTFGKEILMIRGLLEDRVVEKGKC